MQCFICNGTETNYIEKIDFNGFLFISCECVNATVSWTYSETHYFVLQDFCFNPTRCDIHKTIYQAGFCSQS